MGRKASPHSVAGLLKVHNRDLISLLFFVSSFSVLQGLVARIAGTAADICHVRTVDASGHKNNHQR